MSWFNLRGKGIGGVVVVLILLIVVGVVFTRVISPAGATEVTETWDVKDDVKVVESLPDKNVMVVDSKNEEIEVIKPYMPDPEKPQLDDATLLNETMPPKKVEVSKSTWKLKVTAKLEGVYIRNFYILPTGTISGGEYYRKTLGTWSFEVFAYTRVNGSTLRYVRLYVSASPVTVPQNVSKIVVYIGSKPVIYRSVWVYEYNVYKLGATKVVKEYPVKVVYVMNGETYIHNFTKKIVVEFTIVKTGSVEYMKTTLTETVKAQFPLYDVRNPRVYAR